MEILTTIGLVVVLVLVLMLKDKTREMKEENARLCDRRNAEINLRVRIARENAAIRSALFEAGLKLEEVVEPNNAGGGPATCIIPAGFSIFSWGVKAGPKFKVVKNKNTKPHA